MGEVSTYGGVTCWCVVSVRFFKVSLWYKIQSSCGFDTKGNTFFFFFLFSCQGVKLDVVGSGAGFCMGTSMRLGVCLFVVLMVLQRYRCQTERC